MKRVLILGGGFGGIATAHRLKQRLADEVEVIMVDRRDHFMVGFRKSWALVGESPLEAGQKPLESLNRIGVDVRRATIEAIQPDEKSATIDGEKVQADALVVALGAELNTSAVPGFAEHAFNVYDPNDVPRAAKAFGDFQGGRVVIGIFGAPYKCPPAPYELAFLVNEKLKARSLKASIDVFTPQPMSLPAVGKAMSDAVERRLADDGIGFSANHKATMIEKGAVVFGEEKMPFDLLLGIAPHRPPTVVRESGLVGQSGWVDMDKRTLATSFADVYAIGDVTQIMLANGKPLPKAGLFAEQMGETVAERIASKFMGEEPSATFTGEGYCFLEVGGGKAMMIEGNFYAEPDPLARLTDATKANMDEKRSFESQRLREWFG